MRNRPQFNFPLFDEVAAAWARRFGRAINPADHDREVARVNGAPAPEECAGFDTGDLDAYHVDMRTTFEALLGWDLVAIITECDAIVLLPEWETSTGAGHEKYVAEATGKAVLYAYRTSQGHWLFLSHDRYAEERLAKLQPLHQQVGIVERVQAAQRKYERTNIEKAWSVDPHVVATLNRPEPVTLIGLMGYAQVGKDTLAAQLVERHGFTRLAFADTLRECLYALNPLVPRRIVGLPEKTERLQDLVDEVGWDKAKQQPEVRALLQRLGTDVGREILGTNIWVDTTLAKIQIGHRCVITDVRFPNEMAAISKLGGKLVRIMRYGYGPVNNHPSETALDAYSADITIRNNTAPEDMLTQVTSALVFGVDAR
jgi:hypothetical protein